jgi:glucosamine-6-phosphate deaminase
VLGLATGGTPIGVYQCLIEWHLKGFVDFSEATAFNLDEYRGVPPQSDQSYRHYMSANLFSKIDIKPENAHIPDGLAEDPARECGRYEKLIRDCGGVDVQLLGIGNNGHIGFNEPDGAFAGETHLVDLSQSTIDANSRFFAKREDVPVQAYTMGVGTIMRARKIVLIASGGGKAEIVRRAFFGAITPEAPASILQLHDDFTLVGDAAALSLL